MALVIETTGETGFNKVIDPLVKERTALRELLREKHGKTASDYRIKELWVYASKTHQNQSHERFMTVGSLTNSSAR